MEPGKQKELNKCYLLFPDWWCCGEFSRKRSQSTEMKLLFVSMVSPNWPLGKPQRFWVMTVAKCQVRNILVSTAGCTLLFAPNIFWLQMLLIWQFISRDTLVQTDVIWKSHPKEIGLVNGCPLGRACCTYDFTNMMKKLQIQLVGLVGDFPIMMFGVYYWFSCNWA